MTLEVILTICHPAIENTKGKWQCAQGKPSTSGSLSMAMLYKLPVDKKGDYLERTPRIHMYVYIYIFIYLTIYCKYINKFSRDIRYIFLENHEVNLLPKSFVSNPTCARAKSRQQQETQRGIQKRLASGGFLGDSPYEIYKFTGI